MVSTPRNMVALDQASVMTPFSMVASIRKCPSIRVTGSTTILFAIAYLPLFFSVRGLFSQFTGLGLGLFHLFPVAGHGDCPVGGKHSGRSTDNRPTDF